MKKKTPIADQNGQNIYPILDQHVTPMRIFHAFLCIILDVLFLKLFEESEILGE